MATLQITKKTIDELNTSSQQFQKVVKQGSGSNITPAGVGFSYKKESISKIFLSKELAALQNHMKNKTVVVASDISINSTTVTLDKDALNKITKSIPVRATNITAHFNKRDDLVVKYDYLSNYDADIST